MSSTSFVARMAARRKAQLTDHVLSEEAVAVVNAAVEAIADLRKAADEEHELEFGPPPPEALPSVAKAPKEPSVPPPPTLPPVPAPPVTAAAVADGDAVQDAAGDAPAAADAEQPAAAADADADDSAAVAAPSTEEPAAEEADAAADAKTDEAEKADEALKKSMEKGIKALLKWYRSEDIEALSGVEGVTMSEDLAGAVVATATIAKFCIDNPVEGVKGPSSVVAEVATTLAEAYDVKAESLPRWRVWIAHLLDVAEGNSIAKEPAAAAAAAPQQQQQPGMPPPVGAPAAAAMPPREEKLSPGQAITRITSLRQFPADPMGNENRTGVSVRRLRDLNISQNVFKQLGMWLRVLYTPMQVNTTLAELGLPDNKGSRDMVVTFVMNPPRTIDFHHFRRYPIRTITDLMPDLPLEWNVATRIILPVTIDPRRRFWAILCTDLEGHPLGMSPVTQPTADEACRRFMEEHENQPWFSPAVSRHVVAPADFAACSQRLMTYTLHDVAGANDTVATQNRIVRKIATPAVRLAERMQRYRLDQSFADELTPASAAAILRVLSVVVAMDMVVA